MSTKIAIVWDVTWRQSRKTTLLKRRNFLEDRSRLDGSTTTLAHREMGLWRLHNCIHVFLKTGVSSLGLTGAGAACFTQSVPCSWWVISARNVTVKVAAVLFRILLVPSWNLNPEAVYSFCGFKKRLPLQAHAWLLLKLDEDRLLPHLFQFIIIPIVRRYANWFVDSVVKLTQRAQDSTVVSLKSSQSKSGEIHVGHYRHLPRPLNSYFTNKSTLCILSYMQDHYFIWPVSIVTPYRYRNTRVFGTFSERSLYDKRANRKCHSVGQVT